MKRGISSPSLEREENTKVENLKLEKKKKKGVETENRLLRLNIIVLYVWTFFFFPLNIPPSAIFNRFIEVLFPFGFFFFFSRFGFFFFFSFLALTFYFRFAFFGDLVFCR